MIKRIAPFLLLATMMALFTVSAVAQDTAAIKGVCKDENGKPIAGASVELANLDNGRKVTVETNSRGEYYSLGVPPGTYKVSLFAADGKPLLYFNNVPVKLAVDTVVDFDLAKLKAEAAKEAGLSEEQRKQMEEVKKENEKIGGLNALLLQAAQQKKDKQYAAAVATMEQAAAQDQTHDVVFGSLADAYVLDNKFPEAEAAYTQAIALAPATSKALGTYHAGLALALLQQGKIEPSMAECDKTAQLDPKQAGQCFYNQGAILTNQGNADVANLAFDKAIAADPTRADAYYQKGVNLLAKARLGQDNKMIPAPGTAEALNKYLELAPDGPYAQAARDLLASIGASVQTTFGSQKKGGKK
jgi:tetratricopeptide (TPR) repeat protein